MRMVNELRIDTRFCDADVRFGDHIFSVHRIVLCSLSEFFLKAFSDPFKEAEKRSLEIEHASPAAVNVLLDFAYGVSEVQKLNKDFELACNVIALSH